jgi:hypothetical protein
MKGPEPAPDLSPTPTVKEYIIANLELSRNFACSLEDFPIYFAY